MVGEYPYSRYTMWIAYGPSKEELLNSLASATNDENSWVTFTLLNANDIKAQITELRKADEDGAQYHFIARIDGDYRPRRGFYDASLRNIGWIETLGV